MTHGTVEEEMLANCYFQCVCGKMHLYWSGKVCPCGEPFPYEYKYVVYR